MSNALSPMLFQFAYPFKKEVLVSQVLINSIYDAIIASRTPATKVSFQIWKQIEVLRG